jgi:hypothetical protein
LHGQAEEAAVAAAPILVEAAVAVVASVVAAAVALVSAVVAEVAGASAGVPVAAGASAGVQEVAGVSAAVQEVAEVSAGVRVAGMLAGATTEAVHSRVVGTLEAAARATHIKGAIIATTGVIAGGHSSSHTRFMMATITTTDTVMVAVTGFIAEL